MDSIIDKLHWLSAQEEDPDTVRARGARLEPYLNRIQAVLGPDFVDTLLEAGAEHRPAELDAAYLRGFLDSFHLWLEVLAPNRDQPACRANKPS